MPLKPARIIALLTLMPVVAQQFAPRATDADKLKIREAQSASNAAAAAMNAAEANYYRALIAADRRKPPRNW